MSKKQFAIVCALLIAVIVLLMVLLMETRELQTTMNNGMNYLSQKIDALTSYVRLAE